MTRHITGTHEQWLAARLELLEAEKELTRRSDELARQRQELPWVRLDKDYRFETDEGSASLKDLFRGRSQLLVYHFMFGPDYNAGCPSCSAIADGFNGFAVHLANHDVTLSAVSRAPLAKLQAYRQRMGWTFPWASALDGDFNFNFDFDVSFTEDQQRKGGVEYNYQRGSHAMDATPAPEPVAQLAAVCGTDAPTYSREPLGHVSVARPRSQGAQRDGHLVAPSRRVRQALSRAVGGVGAENQCGKRFGEAARRTRRASLASAYTTARLRDRPIGRGGLPCRTSFTMSR
jgi:predicted dithiol-disulfide oxidoreductase (DUF899 family)